MQYATDLTDGQWQRIEPLLPVPRWRLPRSGSATPRSPPDGQWPFVFDQDGVSLGVVCLVVLGRGKTVYDYFRRWSLQGVWSQVLDQLTKRQRRPPRTGCDAIGWSRR